MGREGTATFRAEPNDATSKRKTQSQGVMEEVRGWGLRERNTGLPAFLEPPLESACHTEPFRAVERTGALEAGSAWFKFFSLLLAV